MDFRPVSENNECLRYNGFGHPYEEFTCLYPGLGRTYTQWEKDFDPAPAQAWMKENPLVPVAAVIIYLCGVGLGKVYFEKREPLDWRRSLAVWNLGLSLFSLFGALRSWPTWFHLMRNYSVREVYCMDPENAFASGSTGVWCLAFALSKFAELWDTAFIVVHKKKLLFLHIFHHASIVLVCWHSFVTNDASGLLVMCCNYSIHTVMYFYYFLMSIKRGKGLINPMTLTTMQLGQFVIITVSAIVMAQLYFTSEEGTCHIRPRHFMLGGVLALFFFYLFGQFFVNRYKKKPAKKLE